MEKDINKFLPHKLAWEYDPKIKNPLDLICFDAEAEEFELFDTSNEEYITTEKQHAERK